MPESTLPNDEHVHLPGIDAEATPWLSIGLGLTGLALGFRPRLAPLPLALTALAAALYRDPERLTPDAPNTLFAPADGTILAIDEIYDHRFIHSECLRIAILSSPIDVPVQRSPSAGTVRLVEHVAGEYRPLHKAEAAEANERTYIGMETAWGPLLLVQIAGPTARRITTLVRPNDPIRAGERLGGARFGARTDLIVQRDMLRVPAESGEKVQAGLSAVAHVVLPA